MPERKSWESSQRGDGGASRTDSRPVIITTAMATAATVGITTGTACALGYYHTVADGQEGLQVRSHGQG